MRAQTILFLSVDGVKEKLDCRPYRGRGEGNPKKLVEAASRAFPTLSIILTIRGKIFYSKNLGHVPDGTDPVGQRHRPSRIRPVRQASSSASVVGRETC